jgi:formylglycine-generating enzyme required for sulfatase activity
LPDVGAFCNWEKADRLDHPVNCLDWQQAADFCAWAGGRLPSESEWEYAARSRGAVEDEFPWGIDSITCDLAVMSEGGFGCGKFRTWPVCSKAAGDTQDGLCDMAGNVYEWVRDWYHEDYTGAPADGSAWDDEALSRRVNRGGSFMNGDDVSFYTTTRGKKEPETRSMTIGLRCAR